MELGGGCCSPVLDALHLELKRRIHLGDGPSGEGGGSIQFSIPSDSVSLYQFLVKENCIYSMRNFIVKPVGNGLRVASHNFKLRFFVRTFVSMLSTDDFQFLRFRFTPYLEINGMCSNNDIFLIDRVGQVVGKEDPEDIITKAGQSSKRMRLYLEDEEKNKMKCTLFGDFVAEAFIILEKENIEKNIEPLVMVAQLFKPHVYLSDFCIQPSFYGSRVFFNPAFREVE
ncbi:hypothetical protein PIB30_027758 [Stylosanthes scabra]|uniref:DUF223 domain-containing protein n=1 Tax=Stylosanthes scabra TaxID=79078 RepID=A0ABU6YB88_9FABA|nr:hypothetical protein [Stylosanthes scabra]